MEAGGSQARQKPSAVTLLHRAHIEVKVTPGNPAPLSPGSSLPPAMCLLFFLLLPYHTGGHNHATEEAFQSCYSLSLKLSEHAMS